MTVTLSGFGTANATFEAKQTNSSINRITTDANGQFTVVLRHDEQLELSGLPAGTVAKVVEQAPDAGFTPTYWDNGVQGDGIVTVVKDSVVSVIVENDYTPDVVYPVNITVSGNKTLTGRDWQQGDRFEFELQKYLGNDTWEQLGETVEAVDGKTDFTFTDAFANERYAAVGTYYYRVIELVPEAPLGGVTYDRTVHSFSVDVSDTDMDGKLEITDVRASRPDSTEVTKTSNGWNVSTSFTNTYSTTGSATVTIELNKIIANNGGGAQSLAGFTFGLYDGDSLVYTSPATTDRGFARLVLNYTDDGIYNYTLKEIPPDSLPAGWTYSTEEIDVTVVVSDNMDGTLSAVIYMGDEQPTDATNGTSVIFTNTYDPADTELEIDFVEKELSGRKLNANEFTFEVQELDGTALLEGTNNANGTVTFDGSLKFDEIGTYFYNIVETSADGNGVTVDKTTYRVKVTVVDEGGSLKASYVLVNAVGDTIVFRNTYTAQPVSHAINGQKTLRGRTLLNDEFTFVLSEVSVNGTAVNVPASWETNNVIDGTFTFPTISYDTVGTYVYTVYEKLPTDPAATNGITFDTTRYNVTVVVKDDGLGNLYIDTMTYTLANGTPTNALTFVNDYELAKTSAQFSGDKELIGKVNNALLGGEYEFELYKSDKDWNRGSLKETVENGEDGIIEFTAIDFETDEDQYYIVVEKNGGQVIDGVTYDEIVYRVWVEVTDDLKGQLHATVHIYDGAGSPQESILFVNEYSITGSDLVNLSGEKTLNGRDMTEKDVFTFELYEADESFEISSTPIATDNVDSENSRFEFELSYMAEEVGKTFHYVLMEKNAGQTINGVTYATTEYRVTVKVEDDDKGGIKTTVNVNDGAVAPNALHYINEYKAKNTSISFDGQKSLDGIRKLKENDFTFDLYKANEYFGIEGAAIGSVQNKADATFAFEAVTLDQAGTYRFVIKENSENPIGGVIYDETQYRITVTVADDGKGNLIISKTTVLRVEGEKSETVTSDDIVFENSYNADSVDVVLDGEKILNGRTLEEGEFKFTIFEADANYAVEKNDAPIREAVNKADGTFVFDALNFTELGSYYFIVCEDTTVTAERVSFDDSVYHVAIEVKDNENGKLIASDPRIAKAGSTEAVEAIVFTNTYTPKPTDSNVNININKTVVNKGSESIGPENFEFLLENITSGEVTDRLTVKTDTDGNAVITLVFDEEDIGKTYTYKLTEVNDGRENVRYSTAEYLITVTITLDEDNNLVATFTQNEIAVTAVVAEFENEYDYTPTPPDEPEVPDEPDEPDEPDVPDEPDTPDKPEIPQTGDNSNLDLWITLMLISGGAIITLALYGKKRRMRAF